MLIGVCGGESITAAVQILHHPLMFHRYMRRQTFCPRVPSPTPQFSSSYSLEDHIDTSNRDFRIWSPRLIDQEAPWHNIFQDRGPPRLHHQILARKLRDDLNPRWIHPRSPLPSPLLHPRPHRRPHLPSLDTLQTKMPLLQSHPSHSRNVRPPQRRTSLRSINRSRNRSQQSTDQTLKLHHVPTQTLGISGQLEPDRSESYPPRLGSLFHDPSFPRRKKIKLHAQTSRVCPSSQSKNPGHGV